MQPYSPPRDPTAVVGRRVAAGLIDTLLYTALFGFVWQSQASFVRVPDGFDFGEYCDVVNLQTDASNCVQIGSRAYFTTGSTAVWLGLGGFLFAALLFGVLQGITGWTPGKLLLGLRTVAEDGSTPGVGKGLLRGLLWIVDGPCQLFVPIGLVGFITALTTQGHRRVGDMAAKTFVVKKDDAGRRIEVPGMTQTAGGPGGPPWGGPPQPGGWAPPPPHAGGWGAPPPPGASASPSPSPPGPPSAGPATAAPPSEGGPQWDEARGTYIQWDEDSRKWLQWDESSRTWSPISGQ